MLQSFGKVKQKTRITAVQRLRVCLPEYYG